MTNVGPGSFISPNKLPIHPLQKRSAPKIWHTKLNQALVDRQQILQIDRMQNIEIKKKGKSSMESLLEQSAIDNQFNYEVQQMRQIYNKTIKDLTQKIKDQEKYIERLLIQINAKKQENASYQQHLENKDIKIYTAMEENNTLKQQLINLNKKLSQAAYKLDTIENNRKIVPSLDYNHRDEFLQVEQVRQIKNECKKEIYKEITDILGNKVGKFMREMKKYHMSTELEHSIEAFLEEILYVNSNDRKHGLFEAKDSYESSRKRKVGHISQNRHRLGTEKLSDLEEWRQMQRSMNKLKNVRPVSRSPETRKTTERKSMEERYEEAGNMSVRPLMNYV